MKEVAAKKKVVVVGLGQTGLSCVRFLQAKNINVSVVDSREHPPGESELKIEFPQVTYSLGRFDLDLLLQADEVVVSPGVAMTDPALQQVQQKGIPIIGDIDLFCREARAPIVAITGSNAKSTVTDLVGAMARTAQVRVKVGGNIGTPVLELLGDSPSAINDTELYVLELSSFQLETTHELKAAVATVLNVSEDHMDRYDGMESYVAAKHRIFNGSEMVVINRDDPMSQPISHMQMETLSFGFGNDQLTAPHQFGVMMHGGKQFLAYEQTALLAVDELKIVGKHNVANALAALALGTAVNLDMAAMLATLKEYRGLPHRCQWIGSWNEVDWFNDSKGTNVGATKAAIEGLAVTDGRGGKIVLIAGGMGKQQDFTPLKSLVEKNVRHTFLIGQDAPLMQAILPHSTRCKSLQQAVEQAWNCARPGDRVLLSPACASFDMFSGYDDRGQKFVDAVSALAKASDADCGVHR